MPSPKNIVFACKLHQFKVRFVLSLDISGGVEKRSGIVLLLSYLQRKELLSYLQGKEGTFSFPTLSVPAWLLFKFNTQNKNIICENTPRSCTPCQRRQGCILYTPPALRTLCEALSRSCQDQVLGAYNFIPGLPGVISSHTITVPPYTPRSCAPLPKVMLHCLQPHAFYLCFLH